MLLPYMGSLLERLKRLESTDLFGKPFTPEELERMEKERVERARRAEERLRLEQENPRFVITMVHGTFAKNATWINPASPFGRSLRDRLPPAHVEAFDWSGSNSVKARAEASEQLRARLRKLCGDYPNAHHAIIAHSHGGNVALAALADEELAGKMLGIVTLGTPFLSAQVITPDFLLGIVEGSVAATFSGIGVFALGAALGHGRSWWLAGLLTFVSIAGVLALAAYATKLMESHARRVCDAMPDTKLKKPQLAIIRTSSDEAAATLSGARVAGVFVVLFWTFVSSGVVAYLREVVMSMDYFGMRALQRRHNEMLAQQLRQSEIIASAISGRPVSRRPIFPAQEVRRPFSWSEELLKQVKQTALPYAPLLVFTLLDSGTVLERWAGVVLAVGYGIPAILALFVSVISVPFGVIFALGLLPCGWTLPFAGPYLDLTAEPAPPGTWSVIQLRTEVQGETLSHSKAHDHSSVFEETIDWLLTRATEKTTQG
jgi:hypothetical protein